jgi:hypothetical protein
MAMDLFEYFYNALIFTGIIVILFTLAGSSVIGYMVGYSFICAGYILLLGYISFSTNKSGGTIYSFLQLFAPILLIIGTIIWYLSLVGIYQRRITDGTVAPGYFSFSNIFLILIFVETIVFYRGIKKDASNNSLSINKITSMVCGFLGLLNILVLISIHIILAYFSTDG